MSKKTRILLLLCPLLLASCGANSSLENKGLKGALDTLRKAQNYTLTSTLSTGEVTKAYYTKSAILKEKSTHSRVSSEIIVLLFSNILLRFIIVPCKF